MSENQPIFILPEGTVRDTGKNAQRNNIMAAKIVAETVRTTLGPKGMDKMIVDSLGDVTITNDGVTILEEMQIEHPAAKMIVEVAKTQEEEVGDGTTTAVIIAGELLKNAENLIEKNIHPTVITKGYRLAAEKAIEILNSIAEPVTKEDEDTLTKVAMTAMTGKGAESHKELLSKQIVQAIIQVADGNDVDIENIKLEKKTGDGIENSQLIKGIVLDKERVHSGMPKKIQDGKIALIDIALEIKNPETDTKIQITNPKQMQAFVEQEEKMLKEMADKIVASGANVVVCQKGIDDLVQHFLAKKNIYAVRRVSKSDMERVSRATGAKIISKISDLSKEDLGEAGTVEERKVGDEEMTYIIDCPEAKAVTLLIRGGSEHVIDEVERAVKDAIGDIIASLKDGKVVGGAGAPEIEVSRKLREYANTLQGREQLAVLSFAEAVEIVPRTLAENAGLDPIDMLTELKAEHDKGNKWHGINVFEGKVMDIWANSVIEPLKIKTQAIKSASEVAELILRIDDVIAGSKGKNHLPQMPPGAGMPGMGEY
ncbi:MAG: thermosome subunit alpha [Candidatus Woesearchaeota archaeon]